MLKLAILFLILFPIQTEPQKVALVFGPEPERIEFMATPDAERLYSAIDLKMQAGTATDEDRRLHAALTVALGTLRQDVEEVPQSDIDRSRREQRRWHRQPLQKPDSKVVKP
jgi:hypothetical protein